jgi:Leucine-rich repeat (LRR) protein
MWPFAKKPNFQPLHPLLQQFTDIMKDPRCLEWFEKMANGATRNLPLDVAIRIQEAITLSNSITALAATSPAALIRAVRSGDVVLINKRMQDASKALDENAIDTSRPLARIIEWANDHKLPELRPFDAFFYKECGVPRDIRRLQNLRYLLVSDDHGITEIPEEFALLPLLQGISLSNNSIRSIPPGLYRCPSLRRLDLEGNNITRVEDGIHGLRTVTAIDLSGNRLEHVTPDIAKMPSLRDLDISGQKNEIDFMRAEDTPLSEAGLDALYTLVERINVKY